jgi:hypothetical protein
MTRRDHTSYRMSDTDGKNQVNDYTDSAFGAAVRTSLGGRNGMSSGGHINVKSQPEWGRLFESLRYVAGGDLVAPTPWSRLFRRNKVSWRLPFRERWRRRSPLGR